MAPAPAVNVGGEVRRRRRMMEKMSIQVVRRPAARRSSHAGLLLLVAIALAGLGAAAWARGFPGFVSWQLARSHPHGQGGRSGSRVWSSEPEVVSSWLERHGTPVPPLPSRAGSAMLVGAHYCSLLDRVAAHVVYQGDEGSVSIFVLHGPLRAASGWSARVHGIDVRFVPAAGRVLAIVGEQPDDVRAAVKQLMTSVAAMEGLPAPGRTANLVPATVGAVAQLGARVNGIHEVAGSIPASSTNS